MHTVASRAQSEADFNSVGLSGVGEAPGSLGGCRLCVELPGSGHPSSASDSRLFKDSPVQDAG